MSRPGAAVAVALLALSAGCTGLFGTAGPDRDPYQVPPPTTTPTETPDVEVALGAAGERAPSLRERPDGESTLVSRHERTLRAAGNVTVNRTETVTTDGRTVNQRFRYRIDYERDRYWSRLVRDDGAATNAVTYATDEVAYSRTLGDGSVRYETTRDPRIGEKTVGDVPVRAIEGLFANRGLVSDLVPNGTTVFDGNRVRRYTVRALPGYARQKFSSVAEFDVTVLVDRDGIVRLFEYTIRGRTAAGERYEERSRLTVAEVGNTTVPRPTWAGNATDPGVRGTTRQSPGGDRQGNATATPLGHAARPPTPDRVARTIRLMPTGPNRRDMSTTATHIVRQSETDARPEGGGERVRG